MKRNGQKVLTKTRSFVKPTNPRILTINGDSSSIKFALFEVGDLISSPTNAFFSLYYWPMEPLRWARPPRKKR